MRRRRQRVKSTENWDLFYYKFSLDHALPNLIWNFKCREELRESIENEIRAFHIDKDLGQGYMIAWNYQEFEVPYVCLNEEIKIGEYYLRLLLESGSDIIENITRGLTKSSGGEEKDKEKKEGAGENGDASVPNGDSTVATTDESTAAVPASSTLEIKNAISFFNDLYHRFLLSSNMKSMCLQAMTIVYTKCHEEIGPFNDTKYIIGKLSKDRNQFKNVVNLICLSFL